MNRFLSALVRPFSFLARSVRALLGRIVYFLVGDMVRADARRIANQAVKKALRSNHRLDILQKLVSIHSINKEKVDYEMSLQKGSGVSGEDAPGGVIVSLTSYPARIYDIHYAIHSLLAQTTKPERVILWLGREKFPEGEKTIPEKVLRLKERGLEIRFCKDMRAFTKLVPALKLFPGKTIVTADDDIFYPGDWLEKMVAAYRSDTKTIWSNRVRSIFETAPGKIAPYRQWKLSQPDAAPSFANFLTGVGGVLYPPGTLHADVLDEDSMRATTPGNDDIWFWAMAVREGTRIGVVPGGFPGFLTYVNPRREIGLLDDGTLSSDNVAKDRNEEQLAAVLDKYPEVLERLRTALASSTDRQNH